MKNHIRLTILIMGALWLGSCSKSKTDGPVVCDEITLGQPFTATFGQAYCVPQTNWVMILGPFIEDSRCNIPEILCVWDGQYVMGVTFEGPAETIDTFFAVHNWKDTLVNGPHTIILNEIYPLTRTSFDPLDLNEYSFEMVVK
jgi:hypothetical protein